MEVFLIYRYFNLKIYIVIINLLSQSLLASNYVHLDEDTSEINIEIKTHLKEHKNSHRKILEYLKKYLPQTTSEKDIIHISTSILKEFCAAGEIVEASSDKKISSFSIDNKKSSYRRENIINKAKIIIFVHTFTFS